MPFYDLAAVKVIILIQNDLNKTGLTSRYKTIVADKTWATIGVKREGWVSVTMTHRSQEVPQQCVVTSRLHQP